MPGNPQEPKQFETQTPKLRVPGIHGRNGTALSLPVTQLCSSFLLLCRRAYMWTPAPSEGALKFFFFLNLGCPSVFFSRICRYSFHPVLPYHPIFCCSFSFSFDDSSWKRRRHSSWKQGTKPVVGMLGNIFLENSLRFGLWVQGLKPEDLDSVQLLLLFTLWSCTRHWNSLSFISPICRTGMINLLQSHGGEVETIYLKGQRFSPPSIQAVDSHGCTLDLVRHPVH